MNDEQFQEDTEALRRGGYVSFVDDIRARDTAQRKEIAELRAALATQPAAGEPVAPIGYANPKHLARMAAGEMGSVSVLAERSPDENHTAPVFGAPPAAAHGDEAVRKPELVGYFSFCEDKQKWLQQKSKGAEFNHLFTPLYAMRAQGEVGAA